MTFKGSDMRRTIFHVIGVLAIAFCLFDFGYGIWEFFFEHDGVAFYANRPALAAIVLTIAVVSAVIWHMILRRRVVKKRESGRELQSGTS